MDTVAHDDEPPGFSESGTEWSDQQVSGPNDRGMQLKQMSMKQKTHAAAYIADIEPLKNEALYAAAFEQASAERKARILRYRFASDRALSLGAELLLRKLLADFGYGRINLRYAYGAHQKPYLEDAPGFHFSLSHSKDYVMAAASLQEIGCDIQKIIPTDLSIAKRFFSESEYRTILALPESEQNVMFFRLWALKESFQKATGRGFSLPLNRFEILFDKTRVSVLQSLDPQPYCFAEPCAPTGYRCAVCKAGDSLQLDCKLIDLETLIPPR